MTPESREDGGARPGLAHSSAEIYVPDGRPWAEAAQGVTHLGIGAHQDDLEFMALDGILAGAEGGQRGFGGIICTDGAGSVRDGLAGMSNEELCCCRREEQREAARLGHYGVVVQLAHPSESLRREGASLLERDLRELFAVLRPECVYTHNPADAHRTHVAVFAATVRALRALPSRDRPARVYGCEVWRGLDWLDPADQRRLDVSAHPDLAARLRLAFHSQMAGGKRYDLAVEGRYRANATFADAYSADAASQVSLAMDLTALVRDDSLDLLDFTLAQVDRFRESVQTTLRDALKPFDGSHHPA